MKRAIDTELKVRKFDELKDKEFRICDKCGFTWPETIHYCRCGNKEMMRREKFMIV